MNIANDPGNKEKQDVAHVDQRDVVKHSVDAVACDQNQHHQPHLPREKIELSILPNLNADQTHIAEHETQPNDTDGTRLRKKRKKDIVLVVDGCFVQLQC